VIQRLGDLVPRVAATAWVHENATIIGDVEIGEESSVWPGAVIRGDFGPIRIGARTSIQDNAVIHADERGTVIGNDCIVGHLSFIEAAVVEDACLVGVGAYVLFGACLRTGSVAAAGAVLVGDLEVPSGHRAQGVPAVVVPINKPDRDYMLGGSRRYADMARRHATEAVRVDEGPAGR
jgi:carbonic anhydrase/acetyltransferase-like protein (isoleucine patch superfamily)